MMNNKGFTLLGASFLLMLVCCVGLSIYGLYLAFTASIILGIIVLVVEPSPFIFGLLAIFGLDVAGKIQAWINFPI